MHMCYAPLPSEIQDLLTEKKEQIFYFIRNSPGMVPLPTTQEEACHQLPTAFETGCLSGDPLQMLYQIIFNVYSPMLSYHQHRSTSSTNSSKPGTPKSDGSRTRENTDVTKIDDVESLVRESRALSMLRDEFVINMQKFSVVIQRTIQQIEGEVKLEIPDLEIAESDEENLKNASLMSEIEMVVMGWDKQVSETLEELLKKTPNGPTPMAEIDFWRERNAQLSALVEQYKLPKVVRILHLYSIAENISVESHKTELIKYYTEAKDNVKFLSLVERHFKNLSYGANFATVIETILPMMQALRMIWIISRHYNRDERMVPLMERIAWVLSDRVARVIDIRSLYE